MWLVFVCSRIMINRRSVWVGVSVTCIALIMLLSLSLPPSWYPSVTLPRSASRHISSGHFLAGIRHASGAHTKEESDEVVYSDDDLDRSSPGDDDDDVEFDNDSSETILDSKYRDRLTRDNEEIDALKSNEDSIEFVSPYADVDSNSISSQISQDLLENIGCSLAHRLSGDTGDVSGSVTMDYPDGGGKYEPNALLYQSPLNSPNDGLPQTWNSILEMPRPVFAENYRNPCWVETMNAPDNYSETSYRFTKVTSENLDNMSKWWRHEFRRGRRTRLRCLPYFYIVGQPKCGTTDLFYSMMKHPDLSPGALKEPHWWTRTRLGWRKRELKPIQFRHYLDLFDQAAECIRLSTHGSRDYDSAYHHMITGEASASTLWDNAKWRGFPENEDLTEPKVITAHYLHHIQPGAKIIIILREPVSRLYSDYLYFNEHEPSAEEFHNRVVQSLGEMHECFSIKSERTCIYDRMKAHKVRLRPSMYAPLIEDWMKIFPRQQIFITRLEDYSKDRTIVISQILKFLGIAPFPETVASELSAMPVSNKRAMSDRLVGPMLNATRRLLEDFYRPYNERLVQLLQDNRFYWRDTH